MERQIICFNQLGMQDVDRVGGKNASLGEMISHLDRVGVKVPDGFATTADAFREYLQYNRLDRQIAELLEGLDSDDVRALTLTGAAIRQQVVAGQFPPPLEQAIREAFAELEAGDAQASFAVRSSATAEDLPEASFAGQQETFLNVHGIDGVLEAIRHVFASLYNDRAIAYRVHQGFDHNDVALSAGVQRMVRADLGAAGVMFTLDTESGFDQVVLITSSYGLGEMVVQGAVNPDEFYVYKPALQARRPAVLRRQLGSKREKMIYADSRDHGKQVTVAPVDEAEQRRFSLSDAEVEALARQALLIEQHYGRPMDIEWARDGGSGELYILQARPETVKSRSEARVIEQFVLSKRARILSEGRAIGHKIGVGPARVIASVAQMHEVQPGDVLVTDMTDPDWEPVMKRAAAIVTNRGGRTCHAAIIAREMGIPAVVGCADATETLRSGAVVTVSCAEGDTGLIYEGELPYDIRHTEIDRMPELPFKVMMNVANPERAFDFAQLPNHGVGLARLEFIINRMIGIHPRAVLEYDRQPERVRQQIDLLASGYPSAVEFYVAKLTEGIATIAAAFHPQRVIVRLSDFKSNEYANLLGGEAYEPHEENPMLGFRGASRYIAPEFADCFALECQAITRVRQQMGLDNVEIMIPFVRTVCEAAAAIDALAANGLKRGEQGLKVQMMCELPSNALLAGRFLRYFDGFSIGSNDLTQLTLGLDRDSGMLAGAFDERDDAVRLLLAMAISAAKKAGKYVGICGQGPSDYEDFAAWLVGQGIDSVSLNPDSVVSTWLYLAEQHRAEMEDPLEFGEPD